MRVPEKMQTSGNVKMSTEMKEDNIITVGQADSTVLHQCVFSECSCHTLLKHLEKEDINSKDRHGNTALHLAVMMGRFDMVSILLDHGALVKEKNNDGWTALAEAISYGNREVVTLLLKELKNQSRNSSQERRPELLKAMSSIKDFYMEIKWDFHSWLPLVSRILPSDVCRIRKKGCKIRMDATLTDFNEMNWQRGDITFIFNGEAPIDENFTVLDNVLKVYQRITPEQIDEDIEEEVNILMSNDIVSAQVLTKQVAFQPEIAGWIIRSHKSEAVGGFLADFYLMSGLCVKSRKRREHLSDEDLKRNKSIMMQLARGSAPTSFQCPKERRSLTPPKISDVGWKEYIENEKAPRLTDRPIVYKENSKSFKAVIALSEEFPMDVTSLLDVLEVLAPIRIFSKLRKFMVTKLPEGFPVKLEIPIFPTVTAKVTFQKFSWEKNIPSFHFQIPRGYFEDPCRFSDL